MDYEKKNKEAMNWMRELYPGLHGATKEDAEHYFPELAESEDERIRKLLVWQVHRNIEDETNDLAQSVYDGIKGHDPDLEESIEDWKKCLAYLEKQKDLDKMIVVSPEVWDNVISDAFKNGKKEGEKQKEQHFTKRNAIFDKCVENCDPATMKKVSEEVDEMLQKEQKPAECGDDVVSEAEEYASKVACGEYGVEVTEAYIAGVLSERNRGTEWSEDIIRKAVKEVGLTQHQIDWFKTNVFPPKPEWSDSVAKEMFIKALERAVEQTKKGYGLTDCDKHSWWEDFKAYCGIAPAEWSEEDEKIRQSIIKDIEWERNYISAITGKVIGKYNEQINWLKSLRPQPHWKPSEEQMKALEEVRTIFHHHHLWDEINPILYDYEELMRDLQKLL